MFDRRLIQCFDWGLFGLTLLLGALGLVAVYSAVTPGIAPQKILYLKQWIWYGVGLTAMVISFLVNYKILYRLAHPIYVVSIILLICVLFFGKYVGGSRRWLIMGPVSVQPSELVKLAVIIALARHYSELVNIKGLKRTYIAPAFHPHDIDDYPFYFDRKTTGSWNSYADSFDFCFNDGFCKN